MANWSLRVNGATAVANRLRKAGKSVGDAEQWVVGVGVEYGAYVEFGTSTNRAQPYLFPAADHVMRSRFEKIEKRALNSKNPLETLTEELALEIEREAKKRAPVDTGALRASIEAAPIGKMRGRR